MGHSKDNWNKVPHLIVLANLLMLVSPNVWGHVDHPTNKPAIKVEIKSKTDKNSKSKPKTVNTEETKDSLGGMDGKTSEEISSSSFELKNNETREVNPEDAKLLGNSETKTGETNEVIPSSVFSASQSNEELSAPESKADSESTQLGADSGSTNLIKVLEADPEKAREQGRKSLTDLVDLADKNIETSVATTPEELKNGAYNPNDSLSSLSSITYHTNNEAICLKSKGGGKPDGAICEEWLDREVSSHGKSGDSSPLERGFYQMWESAKSKISESAYRIWDIALKAKENLFDMHGRLNTQGLAKFQLNKEATEMAVDLGTKSAEQALRTSMGADAPKAGETVAPPPEMLRAIAVNISRGIVNHATAKWSEVQAAKKGVEVLKNDSMDEKKYKSEVENGENTKAAGEERLLAQAPLDMETQGLSLEERTARAESLKNVGTDVVNPTFEGNKLVSGNPNEEDIVSFGYRATIEQMADPFKDVTEISKPEDIQLSEKQIAAELVVGSDSDDDQNQKITVKAMTPRQQIEAYNKQLEIAARNMEKIAAESSSFVNTADKIRANKLKEGESILTINDLTPMQKKELKKGMTTLSQNPNTKVEIPRAASQLTITRY